MLSQIKIGATKKELINVIPTKPLVIFSKIKTRPTFDKQINFSKSKVRKQVTSMLIVQKTVRLLN